MLTGVGNRKNTTTVLAINVHSGKKIVTFEQYKLTSALPEKRLVQVSQWTSKNISRLKVSGSRPAPGKRFEQMFRALKTFAQRRLRTVDRQIFILKLILVHHLGLC